MKSLPPIWIKPDLSILNDVYSMLDKTRDQLESGYGDNILKLKNIFEINFEIPNCQDFIFNDVKKLVQKKEKLFHQNGLSFNYKPTANIHKAIYNSIHTTTEALKSVQPQFKEKLEGDLIDAFLKGKNLKDTLGKIEKEYDIARNRAKNILLRQQALIVREIDRATSMDNGFYFANWIHVNPVIEKKPRISHLEAWINKLLFDIRKGAFLDGKWTLPGKEWGCLCSYATNISIRS